MKNDTGIRQKLINEYWFNKISSMDGFFIESAGQETTKKQGSIIFEIEPPITTRIRSIAKNNEKVEYIIYLSFFAILLYKYYKHPGIWVSSPGIKSNVNDDGKELFLFYKLSVNENDSLKKIFQHTREEYQESINYKDYDHTRLKSLLEKSDTDYRFLYYFGFFDHRINMESPGFDKVALQLRFEEITNQAFKFRVKFDGVLFEKSFVQQLASHYQNLLLYVHKDLDETVGELDILSQSEKQQLLFEFNRTKAGYPKNKTIHQLFEEQVDEMPGGTAAILEDKHLNESRQFTYSYLNSRANQLGHLLRKKGANIDSINALILKPSFEMIMGILGILKSGGAYLPIDPDTPGNRILSIIRDAQPLCLLGGAGIVEMYSFQYPRGVQLLRLTEGGEELEEESGENLNPLNQPADLSYIIYTSGSTGKPKGVMIEHQNIVRLIFNEKHPFDFSSKDTWTMFHSYCFDFSVWEMYGALLNGAKLVIVPKEVAQTPQVFSRLLEKEQVTILNQIPTIFNHLAAAVLKKEKQPKLNIRYIIFGGETLNPVLLKRWHQVYPGMKLVNMYGITETTVHVTCKTIGRKEIEEGKSNIGMPIPTLSCYIMSRDFRLEPIGIPGEIVVGGDGVGRGYLNQPGLTQEKFTFNPYVEKELVYRSGDLGKRLPGGDIEFLGRIDNQVKVRGYRIECGEIESKLTGLENIKEAVVIARDDKDMQKYLVAYFTAEEEADITACRTYLSKRLPDYMIPAYFVQLEKFPLTVTGKIDKKALPEPGRMNTSRAIYEAPHNGIESKLVKIWQQVLGIEKVGINDDFFDLGGNSIRGIQVVNKIQEWLEEIVHVTVLFESPTIKKLANSIAYLTERISLNYSKIEVAPESEYYELSHAQKRLWILDQFEKNQIAYLIPTAISVEGDLAVDVLQRSFETVVKRHESLRTTFLMLEGKPRQKVHGFESRGFTLNYTDLRNREDREKHAEASIIKEVTTPFDLKQGPLLRTQLIHLEEKRYLFMFTMHHIISDGWSMQVLIEEVLNLYDAYKEKRENPLPPLRLQYKDYSEWQNSDRVKEIMKKQETYWLKEFKTDVPVMDLPTDFPRPGLQSFEGNRVIFELREKDSIRLKKLTRLQGVTLFMLLMAAFKVFLSKISGQEDIAIGTPILGRRHPDLERIIGMFVNTLVLRNFPLGKKKFTDFLKEVRERTLTAFENQDYQFEDFVEKVIVARDMSRNPLFDVMFTIQDIRENTTHTPLDLEIEDVEIGKLKIKPVRFRNEYQTTKFDLTLTADERKGKLTFVFEYRTELFRKETILRYTQYFETIISSIIRDPEKKISEIEIIPEEEKNRILYTFNDTKVKYPQNNTIPRLFEEQVERTSDHIALVGPALKDSPTSEPGHFTYRELDRKANHLANLLQTKDLKSRGIAGIMVERSIEMIVGMLAILKVGGAYLPLDPKLPGERITYMLKDSNANILLTQRDLLGKFEGITAAFPGSVIDVSHKYINNEENPDGHENTQENRPISNNLAYVIYTSGSTGKPKGVMIEHQNVLRLVKNSNYIEWTGGDKLLLTGALVFDITTFEIWGPLLNGISLYLLKENVILDAKKLEKIINKSKISILHLIPQALSQLAIQSPGIFAGLRYLLTGGDLVRPEPINDLKGRYLNLKVLHMYGPTENTTFSTFYPVDKHFEITIPIGKPVSNSSVYIVDKYYKLKPLSTIGELGVGGDGVARGYLNNPELTQEKFIENPFVSGEKLYRTGDLAKWLPDGNIEFIGRIDHQVKIRGQRIELGEIEHQILRYEDIKEAVVLSKEKNGDKFLCAYIVPGKELDISGLKGYLSHKLPDYMVPSYFVQLEKMPLTSNGKLDRKALPTPGIGVIETYVYPENEMEKKLCEIWSEILGIEKEKIGIEHNFFELGGNSLNLMMLIAKIFQEFGTEVSVTQIYEKPVIKEISHNIRSKKYVEEAAVLLNQSSLTQKTLFCFPPAIAMGFVYQGMASKIKDYPVYSFNFIEDGNRLKKYVDIIKNLKPVGPYILFGWSAAGRLTFQVTKALENHGSEVSDIILADCFWHENITINYEMEREIMQNMEKEMEDMGLGFLKEKVIRKKEEYLKYLQNLKALEVVNANVHLILSESDIINDEMVKSWDKLTHKTTLIYQGFGEHAQMFDPGGPMEKNTGVIKKILDGIA